MNAVQQGYVSVSEIADLVGISRGAVSNWRRRKDDFPQPVGGTPSKPLFDRGQVTAWLETNGYRVQADAAAEVWAIMNMLRGAMSMEESVDAVLGLIARRIGAGSGFGDRLPSEVEHQIIKTIDRIPADQLAEAVDSLLRNVARSYGRSGGEHGAIDSRTSILLASLAVAHAGEVLYDPACGIAAALMRAVDDNAHPVRMVGHEINERAARWAELRAALRGVTLEMRQGDVLRYDLDPDLRADTIIAEPPFGLRWDEDGRLFDPRYEYGLPPKNSADMAWIQHVVAHLTDTGRGYVISSQAPLFRSGAEARIRAELLRRGCVEAVVSLPGKMLQQTAIPLALWVLCRPGASSHPGQVLLVDATAHEAPETHVSAWLTQGKPEIPHRVMAVDELIAADAVLTASKWIEQPATAQAEVATAFHEGWRAIHHTLHELPTALTAITPVTQLDPARVMTVQDLIAQGMVDLQAGRSKDRYPDQEDRVVTPADIRTLLREPGDSGIPEDTADDVTQAGDVLVSTTHRVHARTDVTGGHIPTSGLHRLRVLAPDVLSPGYLAHALTGQWNDRLQTGTTIQRAPIKSLEVPLIPLEQQHEVEHTLTALDELRDTMETLTQHTTSVSNALLDAARYNLNLHEQTK